jgi:thiazole/oxazole-forming peptide maturase SagC family component
VVLVGDADLVAAVRGLLEMDKSPVEVAVVTSTHEAARLLRAADVTWQLNGGRFHETIAPFEEWRNSIVVSVDRIVNPLHARTLNMVAYALGFPVIHAGIDGPFLMVGPTVLPKQTACYECFDTRILMNMRQNSGYQSYKNALAAGNIRYAELPLLKPLAGLLAAHVALETINLAVTGSNFTINKALTIHVPTMEICFHDVLKLPSCTTCGSVAERDDQELYIDMRSLVAAPYTEHGS